jgi:single-strand DNA-binding protein
MLNRVIIAGRLGADPELRTTQSGVEVCNITLAVDRDFKDKDTGERGVDWIPVVAWRGTATFLNQYFSKGCIAIVEGRLQVRDWSDDDGNKHRVAEVVADNIYFGDSKKDDSGAPASAPAKSKPASKPKNTPVEDEFDEDSELPF